MKLEWILLAMGRTDEGSLILAVLTVVGVVASAAVIAGGVFSSNSGATLPTVSLPLACKKPTGGFLIIMSEYGYNDSVLEGAGPTKAWPLITVSLGAPVDIVVCNADPTQSHGFQVAHYYDSKIVAVAPGQVIDVSFVATMAGTFQIYCDIFCTIHLFMQYGQLRVIP